MDLQKEREAFEKHASKFFTDSKEAFKTNGDQYLYDEVIWMWDCWIERAKAQAVPECVWVGIYDGSVFESSCGHTFELSNDGTLDDNNMKHCCFCGGKIEAQEPAND